MPIPPGAPRDDLGKWDREEINEQSRCFWIAKGFSTCQHLNGPFDFSMMIDGKEKRWCTQSMFTRVHNLTQSQTLRDWRYYSACKGTILFHLLPPFQGLQWPILHRCLRLETYREIYFPARDKRTSLGRRPIGDAGALKLKRQD